MAKEQLMKLTKEQLVDKLENERIAFRDLHERTTTAKEQELEEAVASIRHVCDMVIARVVQSFGLPVPGTDELTLDIPKPENPEGKMWVTRVELPDKDTYRIFAKLADIPELK